MSNAYVLRFSLSQRVEHFVTMVVFTLLCLTGLPQKFFDSGWAASLVSFFGGIDSTRWIHRICGIALALSTVVHFANGIHGMLSKRIGFTMVPTRKDFEDAILQLRYYLGMTDKHPRYDRYDYKQKFEYWGLVLVHEPVWISRLYRELDTAGAARRLLADRGLREDEPHHVPISRDSKRRNIVVTLCGAHRGQRPAHRVAVMGNDEAGRQALARAGFGVRPAKQGSKNWRFETVRADYGEAMRLAQAIHAALGGRIIQRANLHGKSLPFVRAAAVRRGMGMVSEDGRIDIVESVRRIAGRRGPVFDIDVHPTHNFIANGIVTHNSIEQDADVVLLIMSLRSLISRHHSFVITADQCSLTPFLPLLGATPSIRTSMKDSGDAATRAAWANCSWVGAAPKSQRHQEATL